MSDIEATTPAPRSRLFFRIRVAVLLTILAGVLLYAWRDVRSRSLRNDWSRTLDVAIVLSASDVDPAIRRALEARAEVLETVLDAEMRRWRPGGPAPFEISVVDAGPVSVVLPPPPADDGLLEAARVSWDLNRVTSALDEAAGIGDRRFDSRVYVIATPSTDLEKKPIEGLGEQGGRVGVVKVELHESMVDFALFVVTHELLHTLGAGDRYDGSGRPLVPEGLADPDRTPLYPQDAAEVMARHRALSPSTSAPPESLDELVVGEATAREIGWIDSAP